MPEVFDLRYRAQPRLWDEKKGVIRDESVSQVKERLMIDDDYSMRFYLSSNTDQHLPSTEHNKQ